MSIRTPAKIRVFLCYVRSDDNVNQSDPEKSFLRRLYIDLITAGFEVWWDRESLPSRDETFTWEIELAIRHVDRFVVVVSESIVKFDHPRKEWEFAQAHCLAILPILRQGDYSLIPAEIRSAPAIDFRTSVAYEDALEDLISRLTEDTGLGKCAGVPQLPEAFYRREKPFKAAHEALRVDNINPAVTSPHAVTIYGHSGTGKSTLAAALAMDCEIRHHYRDGVIWLPIGQTPEIISRQTDIGLLFGDAREHYTDAETGKSRLRSLLANKKVLIVLDDVWDQIIVEHFPTQGTACRVLLTTRNNQIAERIQGKGVRLNFMAPEEGAALIARRTQGNSNDARSKALSRELGGLSLAIALAAAQIAEGYVDSSGALLQLLQKAIGNENPFEGLVVDETDKNLNLEKLLAFIYTNLSPDLKRRFRELGVLALEAPFDRDLAVALWDDTDPSEAHVALTTFQRIGLLARNVAGQYTLHRVIRVYARALLRREKAIEAAFRRYAEAITTHAEQFEANPPDAWDAFEEFLTPHLIEVGDSLVTQFNATSTPDAALSNLALIFSLHAHSYLSNRRQTHRSVWYEMGLKAAKITNDGRRQALFLNELGVAQNARGEPRKALDYYEQALSLFRAVGDRRGEATALLNIGNAWDTQGEARKTLDYYDQALPVLRSLGDLHGEATTLTNIGSAWDALGEHSRALYYYEQAMPLTRAIGDRDNESAVLNNIGSAWDALGEHRKALHWYEQALPLSKEIGDRRGEAATLNNIGSAWDALGEHRNALQYYQQVLHLFRVVGDRNGEAATLNNIGSAWDALGEARTALNYYEQALPLIRAVGDRNGEATTLSNIGGLWDALGNQHKALNYYEQALSLSRATGDRSGEAITLNNIGSTWDALGEKRKALDYYVQALPLSQAVGDRYAEAAACFNIGILYRSLGDFTKAVEYVARCVEIDKLTEHPDLDRDQNVLEQIKREWHRDEH